MSTSSSSSDKSACSSVPSCSSTCTAKDTTEEVFNPFMSAAVTCAVSGILNKHGGPFGACITRNGEIVAVAHNEVLSSLDPSAHAEMVCIRKAAQIVDSHDLSECELYTTC
eukprot:GHVS01027699.1.p3 GENE.GHVS01027699.1~~GHVS01027699.1.p3  ORF type:complete len:121 (-),score=33.40 GHVS01027699.1:1028-1360(-)